MRKIISIWACLALCVVQLLANHTTPVNTTPTSTKTIKAEAKEKLSFIPNRTLRVEVIDHKDLLHIALSGPTAQLDWIIFQPKGEVISRISTSAKIDEVKIKNLETGNYMLMIKDTQGRVLYQPFTKS